MFGKAITAALALAVAVGGVSAAWYYTKQAEETAQRPPSIAPMVNVAVVERGPMQKTINYVGSVQAQESVTVLPKVTGTLEILNVDLGDEVEAGQLIARIDDEEFVQREKQAQANLMLAKAQLQGSKVDLDAAQREMKRTESAGQQGLVTERERDTANAALENAKAGVALAEAEVTRAQAALEEAQINLENTNIYAPMDGQVDRRRVDPGTLLSPSTPICDVIQANPAKIIVDVPESELYLAVVGVVARVAVPGSYDRYDGAVTRVAPALDLSTRTSQVQIAVPNDEHALKPGMSADVTFIAKEKENALLVPESALIRSTEEVAVYRVTDGVAHRVVIRLGLLDDGMAEVLEGLDEGDLVVTEGQFMLEDGDKVRYGADATEFGEIPS